MQIESPVELETMTAKELAMYLQKVRHCLAEGSAVVADQQSLACGASVHARGSLVCMMLASNKLIHVCGHRVVAPAHVTVKALNSLAESSKTRTRLLGEA